MLIVDGHNLIPKIPGWTLAAVDDEQHLVEVLVRYARAKRKDIHVFFDKAPPGQAGVRNFGQVRAHFVQQGLPADEAIGQFLERLKKGARSASVVSSDRHVQGYARGAGAAVISSEDFARMLQEALAEPPAAQPSGPTKVSGSELEEWYSVFGTDAQQAEKPIELGKRKKAPAPARPAEKPVAKVKRHGFPKKGT